MLLSFRYFTSPVPLSLSANLQENANMGAPGFTYLVVFALFHSVSAQFGFFDQMFGGGQQQQQPEQPQNMPSDSSWYQRNVDKAHCDKYLCPDTLGS